MTHDYLSIYGIGTADAVPMIASALGGFSIVTFSHILHFLRHSASRLGLNYRLSPDYLLRIVSVSPSYRVSVKISSIYRVIIQIL